MDSILKQLRIAVKWLLSFTRAEWRFHDYPIRVRRNPVPDAAMSWSAQFLNWFGPIGLGPDPAAALAELEKNFSQIRLARAASGEHLPRPGSRAPLRFAPSTRVTRNPELLQDFLRRVLGFRRDDPVFVSDMSSLFDFGGDEEVERYRDLIRHIYGVETADLKKANLADILERIEQHHP